MIRLLTGITLASQLFFAPQGFAISDPFAQGESNGLRWEARFNLPECRHSGQKRNAWCMVSDADRAAEISGVEDKLISWMKDPKVRSVQMAYFSFSNKRIRSALCEAANSEKRLRVTLYINSSNFHHANVEALKNCSPYTEVISRGKGPFGTAGAHLQHTKIFLASESLRPLPWSDLTESERANQVRTRTRFTSSSANMSSFGTSLHFENWLFFNDDTSSYLAQQNLCTFKAFSVKNDRRTFANTYRDCIRKIQSRPRSDIRYFAVPSTRLKKPYTTLKEMILSAESEILIAIHRLTTGKVYKDLFLKKAFEPGVDVKIIFDDDTLRTGKVNGGPAHDVAKHDVIAYRTLRRDTQITFMETNADSTTHLFHNKFAVVDGKKLFQGAGNFTGTALNISGYGNYEQFYSIEIPEIVSAYHRAWNVLDRRATTTQNHPVGQNRDKNLRDIGSF